MASRRTTGTLLLLVATLWQDHAKAWTHPSPLSLSMRMSGHSKRRRTSPTTSVSHTAAALTSDYGRGAEIWPPGSDETVIQLQDSFPGGVLPPVAIELLQSPPTATRASVQRGVPSTRTPRPWHVRLAKSLAPWWVGLVLVPCLQCVRPLDVLLVTFITGYTILLQRLSQMNFNDDDDEDDIDTGLFSSSLSSSLPHPHKRARLLLPALPPQGHIPWSVQHPLGYTWTHSWMYRQWLRLGFGLGIVAPVVILLGHSVLVRIATMATTATAAAAAATLATTLVSPLPPPPPPLILARPLFLLSCQLVTETVVQRHATVTPLPLRIFVPVAYNTVRLGYLWQSALLCTAAVIGGGVGSSSSSSALLLVRIVAVANLVYWWTNLFGFLLPVAVIRYMRAYFFTVEASRVVPHE